MFKTTYLQSWLYVLLHQVQDMQVILTFLWHIFKGYN